MEPLPATVEVLRLLAVHGDDSLGPRVKWMSAMILTHVPRADALAVWFCDEDLTLAFVATDDAAAAVRLDKRSSISLRIATPTRLIAVVNVYSEHPGAFRGRAAVLERALGAERESSVLDVDLGFEARERAMAGPSQVRAALAVDTAIGLLVVAQELTIDEAERWLHDVARASGRSELDVARQVVAAHELADPCETRADEGPS